MRLSRRLASASSGGVSRGSSFFGRNKRRSSDDDSSEAAVAAAGPADADFETPEDGSAPLTLQAQASLPQGYTFLRLNVNLDGGRLGIGLDDEYCVTQLKPGGPGELAGLIVDDQIVEVNGTSVFGSGMEIATLLPRDSSRLVLGVRRPPAGSTASLAVEFGAEFSEPKEVLLTRQSPSHPLGIHVEQSAKGRGLLEVSMLDAGGAAQLSVSVHSARVDQPILQWRLRLTNPCPLAREQRRVR